MCLFCMTWCVSQHCRCLASALDVSSSYFRIPLTAVSEAKSNRGQRVLMLSYLVSVLHYNRREAADDIYRLISQRSSRRWWTHCPRQPAFIPPSFCLSARITLFSFSHIPVILGVLINFYFSSSSIRPSNCPHTSSIPPPAPSSSTLSCPRLFTSLTLITPLRSSLRLCFWGGQTHKESVWLYCVQLPSANVSHFRVFGGQVVLQYGNNLL